MPRIQRGIVDHFIYHVINRGNGRQEVFHKDGDYKSFIDLMKEAKLRYAVKMFAYCLMPNHFHLLLMPQKGEELSKFMQWLMTSHVRRYHKHHGSSGHLWQGRFKSFIIQKDEHLLAVLRYIESNPIRAGLAETAKAWKWSSHTETSGERHRDLVDECLMELPADWQKFVDTPLTGTELEKIRKSVNRQSPYGAIDWQVKICKDLGLESTMRPRGRQCSGR